MKRIVLGVQYDGTPWQGWQTQPNGKTVQDRLEAALQKFTQGPVDTICAGRTDSGVHALEQVVHFDTHLSREISSWVRGLNAFLPSSIAVRWAHELPVPVDGEAADYDARDQFHARFSATARTYHYLLYNNPVRSPLLEGKAGWVFRPLELELMRQAAAHLVGTHDFSAFRAVECQAKSPVRTMEEIRIERRGDLIVFSLRANAFLHHMVRNIVGSLIYAGNGNKPPEWIAELLLQRNRALAAPTFMPDGLYLAQVAYDPKWQLPRQPAGLMPWL
ncbi:tRNA pseudouridine(38-40) synthase TruA [Collimonas antrihumi]|uniref:tRNA pseudouridine(38-40) synthase TruA n=1 Tax=Collimonas antrihumi TaxID=1940615 RepID=UPI001B8AC190|nr:tRNA pseudouridine(38-40) synthase TruA [Collimonas antrihumi]